MCLRGEKKKEMIIATNQAGASENTNKISPQREKRRGLTATAYSYREQLLATDSRPVPAGKAVGG